MVPIWPPTMMGPWDPPDLFKLAHLESPHPNPRRHHLVTFLLRSSSSLFPPSFMHLLVSGMYAFNWNSFLHNTVIVIRITFWHVIVRLVFSITHFIIEGDMGGNVRKSVYIAHKTRITHYPHRKVFFMGFSRWHSVAVPRGPKGGARCAPLRPISFMFMLLPNNRLHTLICRLVPSPWKS